MSSSDAPVHGSGPSEEGEGDGNGSQETSEKAAAGHGSEEKSEEATFEIGLGSEDDQARSGPPGSGVPRRKRKPVSTDARELMAPVSKKAKQKQVKSEKGKESLRTKKAQQKKASTAGKGSTASPSSPVNTPTRPVRFPAFPNSGTAKDVVKWSLKCRRIGKKSAKDPRFNLPTMRNSNDAETTNAVQSPEAKKMIIIAARSIVCLFNRAGWGED